MPSIGPSYAKKVSDKTSQPRRRSRQEEEVLLQQGRILGTRRWLLVIGEAREWAQRKRLLSKRRPPTAACCRQWGLSLTDAGGRLPNPGTTLPYHYGPQAYSKFGYRMNNKTVQVFDYVVAINFNRNIGKPPRDEGRRTQRSAMVGSGFTSVVQVRPGMRPVKEANMA